MEKDRIDIYLEERKLLIEAQRVSSQQFDKHILTLSSAFLSLSIAFLKYLFPQIIILKKEFLIISWALFSTSILTTLISFLASQNAYKRQIQITEDYYIRQDEKALIAKNHWSTFTLLLNYCSALFFILAVVMTVYFVSINFLSIK
jgi:hypothetical protein